MSKKLVPYMLILPSLSIIVFFVIYPIINSIIRSFQHPDSGSFTFENYGYFFSEPMQVENILYTIFISLATVVFTTIIAYPLSIYLRFSTSKISKWIFSLNMIPYFLPGMVAIYAVILVINDAGVINRIGQLFGLDIKPALLYNYKGIILMNVWFNIPFVTMIVTAALSAVKESIIESAKDIGAKKFTIFYRIILPLTYKDAMIALTFVFMANVGSFTTPFLIGGNSPKMLGVVLFDQFNSYMQYERAAALSVIMFVVCAFSALVYIYTNLKEGQWEGRK